MIFVETYNTSRIYLLAMHPGHIRKSTDAIRSEKGTVSGENYTFRALCEDPLIWVGDNQYQD